MQLKTENQGEQTLNLTRLGNVIGICVCLALEALIGIFGILGRPAGVRVLSLGMSLAKILLCAVIFAAYMSVLREQAEAVARKKLNTARICAVALVIIALANSIWACMIRRGAQVQLLLGAIDIWTLIAALAVAVTADWLKKGNAQKFNAAARAFGVYGTLAATAIRIITIRVSSLGVSCLAEAILVPVIVLFAAPQYMTKRIPQGVIIEQMGGIGAGDHEEAAL